MGFTDKFWLAHGFRSGSAGNAYFITGLKLALSGSGCRPCSITISLHAADVLSGFTLKYYSPAYRTTLFYTTVQVTLDSIDGLGILASVPLTPPWQISSNADYALIVRAEGVLVVDHWRAGR